MILALGAVWCAVAAGPNGEALGELLSRRERVTIVFDGDSVTQGMHLEHPASDAYPVLFTTMLRERYPDAEIQSYVNGVPGASSAAALAGFDSAVASLKPNLVTLQFGGNDKGVGDGLVNLGAYEQNLGELIDRVHALGAACIVLTPPMREPVVDMPYPLAARRVAAAKGAVVADIDTALKSQPFDYRGFFPYFQHPGQRDHATIARELYRAFCELIGRPQTLRVAIPDLTWREVELGTLLDAPLVLQSDGGRGHAEQILARGVQRVLPPGEAGDDNWWLQLGIPHSLSGGRSEEWPIWVHAVAGDRHAFDIHRVTIVPRFNCPPAGTPGAELPLVALGQPNLTVGPTRWEGDDDLRPAITMSYDAEMVYLRIDVRDDVVKTGGFLPYSDGVELYLDLRDHAERGRPFFSRQCATLFINLPDEGEPAKLVSLEEDDPPAALMALVPRCTYTATGYRVELDFPRAVLDAIGGRRVVEFGLDVAVDDADTTGRDVQMMWLGRADNYINPCRLGDICLENRAGPNTVRVTLF